MIGKRFIGIFGLLALLAAPCCKTISSLIHDGNVIARVGDHKLFADELTAYIPDGIPAEDSAALAMQYIHSWASGWLLQDLAEKQLSKAEKDVSRELEEYRRTLLRYRYEQKFVNQRLDTAVTAAQIDRYYEEHPDHFVLETPIVKARFLYIAEDSPNRAVLRRKMASEKEEDRMAADSIAFSSALRYTDFGDAWIDIVTLAREMGADPMSLLSRMRDGYIEIPDDRGNVNVAYISAMLRSGQPGPVAYYRGRIKDIILNSRKQALLTSLEQDLLEKARTQEDFEIY